jgi:hypothetical protein
MTAATSARGSVYVEFLIAFAPILTFFLGLVQLIFLRAAHILVGHAAARTVRAAIVVLHDDPKYYDGEQAGRLGKLSHRRAAIERAAAVATAPLGGSHFEVALADAYGPSDPVTVRLAYDYACRVPIGRSLVCGLSAEKTLTAVATSTNQGADYAP